MPPLIILAGGLGTRLGELGRETPKSLVLVAGQPFIERQFALLRKSGFNRAVLCVGHLGDAITQHVQDGSRFGIQITYSADGAPLLGTGGAARKAILEHLPDARSVGIIYGDSYLDIDYTSICQHFENQERQGLMTVFPGIASQVPLNTFVKNGAVRGYDKKNPTKDMQHTDYGFLLFRPHIFTNYAAYEPFDLDTPIKDLIAQDQLAAYGVTQRFYEVGTPQGIKELETYLV
jgi:N-acetyl-alpha-D-muramate 1-phosphate uridylyltransferase